MALDGVGPSIALGIQEENGNNADFEEADINMQIPINVPMKLLDVKWLFTKFVVLKSKNVILSWKTWCIVHIARINPISPIL